MDTDKYMGKHVVLVTSYLERGDVGDWLSQWKNMVKSDILRLPGIKSGFILSDEEGARILHAITFDTRENAHDAMYANDQVKAWTAEFEQYNISEPEINFFDEAITFGNPGRGKYATVGVSLLRENAIDEYLKRWNEDIKPLTGRVIGLEGGYVLRSHTGASVAEVFFWDSQKSITDAIKGDPVIRKLWDGFSHYRVSGPWVEHYKYEISYGKVGILAGMV